MHTSFGNSVKTAALLGLLSAVLLVAGYLIGGTGGLTIALIIAIGMNGFSYFFSDKLALRSMKAYPVTAEQQPQLYKIVSELAAAHHMPMPALYVSPTNAPNAFATGRNPQHAAVCATEGILAMMDERELRGVLGHEISHVANRDILIASVAGAVASAIVYLAQFGFLFGGFVGGGGSRNDRDSNIFGELLLIILGPLAAGMVQMAISRSREYQADASGAKVTGDPLALASALRKLQSGTQAAPLPQTAQLQPTSALMIANPFRMGGGTVARLFSTHPPMDQRIARLEELAREMSGRPQVLADPLSPPTGRF